MDLSLEHFLRVAKKLFAKSGPFWSIKVVNWNQTSAKKVSEGILSSTDKFCWLSAYLTAISIQYGNISDFNISSLFFNKMYGSISLIACRYRAGDV